MGGGERADSCAKKRIGGGEFMAVSAISWMYYLDIALQLGLSAAETDGFTPGMVTDLAIQRANQQTDEGNPAAGQAPQAGQADYDAF